MRGQSRASKQLSMLSQRVQDGQISGSYEFADEEVARIAGTDTKKSKQLEINLESAEKASKDMLNANYQNVLPSKIRAGNMNVMPLLPKNMKDIPVASDQSRLKQVIQQSAYVLAMYQERNAKIR